ncbi:hypothetical protein CEXT_363721 [Caerostris extrusa]|uniref:Uncharacterized protein n=1 Tax=Caerostris extrusa TaxID=172846 RepID=A0AAV4Y1V5_CAEEX|nr:hypothetical protein CEXT_363721 [Caerostris extrusa]
MQLTLCFSYMILGIDSVSIGFVQLVGDYVVILKSLVRCSSCTPECGAYPYVGGGGIGGCIQDESIKVVRFAPLQSLELVPRLMSHASYGGTMFSDH